MPDFHRSARLSWGSSCLTAFACALTIAGCASWRGAEPHFENQFVAYYDKLAREIAEPDLSIRSPVPQPSMGEGRSLTAPNPDERWHLSLAEAIRLGIENNSVIRQNAQFMSPNNPVMQSPDAVPSVFDPAIQNAGVLFGQRGVDAALSDFDPRLTNTTKVSREENVQNLFSNLFPNNVLATEGVQQQTRLEQQLLSGGVFGINNNWNQLQSNQINQLFDSSYTGVLGVDFRQPLWAGAGRDYTAIAGPLNQRARGFSYVNQGIVIAHINKRLSEIDLQENLQNLVREIGDLYWDLYQNYQDYDSERQTTKLAKDLWDRAKGREGIDPGVEEAMAEDAYYESKSREELALSNLFLTEGKFRRLLGLSLDDSRLLYPSDQPREDEISLNRSMCLYEALVNRIELTRQKINVQSLELQLCAAKKLVAPRVDFVSGYSLNGFGKGFYNSNPSVISRNPGSAGQPTQFNSAVTNLFSGKEQSWNLGVEYSLSLWLRQEKAQVRQLELRIVKGRAALAAQEDEISHELNTVLMTIKRSHSISKITRRRVRAARRRVIAAESDYEAGNKSNDLALRALTSLTQAQAAHSRSISEYNKSLRDLLYRTGRLLPADGISLLGTDGLPVLPPPANELPAPRESEDKDPDDQREEDVDPRLPPLPKKSSGVAAIDDFPDETDERPYGHNNPFGEFASDLKQTQFVQRSESNRPDEEFQELEEIDDERRPVAGRN